MVDVIKMTDNNPNWTQSKWT